MEVLFIAPYPPPFTGNSLPVKSFYEALIVENSVTVINLNKINHVSGKFSFKRLFQIIKIVFRIFFIQKKFKKVYLCIAESKLGNLRDLFLYLVLYKRLSSVYIHLLGGANLKLLFSNKHPFFKSTNTFFLKKIGGVIVEGQEQKQTFLPFVKKSKIHIVNNFAENFLFNNDANIRLKFKNLENINVLFLSNLLEGKGHFELLEAYSLLNSELQKKISLNIAGKVLNDFDLERIYQYCNNFENIKYHGSVSGTDKKKLFWDAHLFCLPTYYAFEGQPFVIIESYAAGCAVITTNYSGIGYIFKNSENGFEVKGKSVIDLKDKLENLPLLFDEILNIAIFNNCIAKEKYTESIFIEKMVKIFFDKN